MQHICPQCQSQDLVDVQISLREGPVRFEHCRNCEHRWWTDNEGHSVIRLGDVLEKVASR